MSGDFPNLSPAITSQWPKHASTPTKRDWFPAYGILLLVLSTVVLCGRLWSNWRKRPGRLRLDDGLAICAWVFALLFTTAGVVGTMKYGFDRHIWDASPSMYERAALIEWLSENAFLFSTCLTKVSVLMFYRRLDTFAYTRTVKWTTYIFIGVTIAYWLGTILYLSLLCRPTTAYWRLLNLSYPEQQSCASQRFSYPIEGTLSILSTIYSILIPYLVLRSLPMSKNHRLGLGAVLVTSSGVVAAGIVRTVFLSQLSASQNGDATWNGFNVLVFSQLECQLTLICACLPFLQRYFLPNPSVPIVYVSREIKEQHMSMLSRVSSSLSERVLRPLPLRQKSVRRGETSVPQMAQIPEWEFETLATPPPRSRPTSPLDMAYYDRYLAGNYGPPPPPKDSRDMFDEYRRERHGGWV